MDHPTTVRPAPGHQLNHAEPVTVGTARAALAGLVGGAAAIAAGELAAGVLGGVSSPLLAVGALLIRLQPPGAKDVMVALFGANDKVALDVMEIVAALAIAAGAGVLEARRSTWGASAFGLAGLVALVAGVTMPGGPAVPAAVVAVVAATAGILVLGALLGVATGSGKQRGLGAVGAEGAGTSRAARGRRIGGPAWDRRRFLIASGGTLVAAGVGTRLGRLLSERQHPSGTVGSGRLPAVAQPVPALAADQQLAGAVTPAVTPTDRFYRIDTALLVPRVDIADWRLRVTGMVDRPITLTYDELLALPLVEQYVTIACVSNPVGGDLVGNALWTGVPLRQLLDMAGAHQEATQIVGRSVDGFTAGFPTAWAAEPGREAMVAVGMNGEVLPAAHGYPARLIVPGLYGYVSATKWLAEIQLTTREAVDGYWVPLGWAKDAPILTQSRIDAPADGAGVAVGPVRIQGVAWAPDRGVKAVEVRVDGGDWRPAELARSISRATWVQWAIDWAAAPGRHVIEARATDGTGAVQTSSRTDPAPDGARGYPRITITAA